MPLREDLAKAEKDLEEANMQLAAKRKILEECENRCKLLQ